MTGRVVPRSTSAFPHVGTGTIYLREAIEPDVVQTLPERPLVDCDSNTEADARAIQVGLQLYLDDPRVHYVRVDPEFSPARMHTFLITQGGAPCVPSFTTMIGGIQSFSRAELSSSTGILTGATSLVAGIEDAVTVKISDVRDRHSLPHIVRGRDVILRMTNTYGPRMRVSALG